VRGWSGAPGRAPLVMPQPLLQTRDEPADEILERPERPAERLVALAERLVGHDAPPLHTCLHIRTGLTSDGACPRPTVQPSVPGRVGVEANPSRWAVRGPGACRRDGPPARSRAVISVAVT
jgi:hypothetical protein